MLSFSYSIISLQHLDFVKHIDKKKTLITFGVGVHDFSKNNPFPIMDNEI